MLDVKEIVKDNVTVFRFYKNGYMFYSINFNGDRYTFPIDINDVDCILYPNHKAQSLEKFIKGAIDKNLFVKKSIDKKKNL